MLFRFETLLNIEIQSKFHSVTIFIQIETCTAMSTSWIQKFKT